ARALMRRTCEAVAVRRLVAAELDAGAPVVVLGDFNDGEHAVSSAIIAGERPFKNYAWIRRHDATKPSQRYSDEENEIIQEAIAAKRLISAEALHTRKSLRDMMYTSAFGGVYESIDQILLSRHFQPDHDGASFALDYLQVFNDHLTDGSFEEAPYNKLASDHGQLVATIRMK
ncbi:MAG: alpha-1,4 polygalactosaminidase, partial [Pseudomonadota bacterium]